MNALEKWLDENFMRDETAVMNRLQENGVISDLCVRASDVAGSDAARAVEWLNKHP